MNTALFRWAASCAAAGMLLAGCRQETSLLQDAGRGEVDAQYELALLYNESDPPRPDKAFEWMKHAAESRYRPAMKKLSEYYLAGYGTPRNFDLSAMWLRRYLDAVSDSIEALNSGRRILNEAEGRETLPGFTLLRIAIQQEVRAGTPDSATVQAAVVEFSNGMTKSGAYLLRKRDWAGARKLLDYAVQVQQEYPHIFSGEFDRHLQELRKSIQAETTSKNF